MPYIFCKAFFLSQKSVMTHGTFFLSHFFYKNDDSRGVSRGVRKMIVMIVGGENRGVRKSMSWVMAFSPVTHSGLDKWGVLCYSVRTMKKVFNSTKKVSWVMTERITNDDKTVLGKQQPCPCKDTKNSAFLLGFCT